MLKVGDIVKDKDGTLGKVIEVKDTWARIECRPHAILANLICHPKKAMRIRKLWNMEQNLTVINI